MNLLELSNLAFRRLVLRDNRVILAAYAHDKLVNAADKDLQRIYSKVNNGKISADEFADQFQSKLASHLQSAMETGKGGGLNAADQRWVRSFAAKQFDFLDGFKKDIEGGLEDAEARVSLYARTVKSAYWKGSISGFRGNVDWVLGAGENCDDCVELADASPHKASDIETVPGAGDTDCLSNCGCAIVESED